MSLNINPIISFELAVSPASVTAAQPVTLSATVINKLWLRNTTYTFYSTGGTITSTGKVATIDTTRLKPGIYTVKVYCSQGPNLDDSKVASGTFTVTG